MLFGLQAGGISALAQNAVTHTWIDYTRRSDPVCPAGLERFDSKIQELALNGKPLPHVIMFWTKNPFGLAKMYEKSITSLREQGVMILAQVTINPGYQPLLEPAIKPEFWRLDELVRLLGRPKHIRTRFDPYIPGFTTLDLFEEHCRLVSACGVVRTTTNFVKRSYKDVSPLLKSLGIDASVTRKEKSEILAEMVKIAQKYGLELQACAEINGFSELVPGLLPPACADREWPKSLGYDLSFKLRPSRRGCGCCYSDDWGEYSGNGGYACPHQCVYCYAKRRE
jgi:DNA repair photolyase